LPLWYLQRFPTFQGIVTGDIKTDNVK
jgi:hypothetical protein